GPPIRARPGEGWRRTEEEAGSMDRQRERQTEELANSYLAHQMSRRTFVMRLLALGLAPSARGGLVAAWRSSAPSAPASAAPSTAAATAAASTGASPAPAASPS